MKRNVKSSGQYFTPRNVAEFMVSLISENIPSLAKVLEPCAGQGVFLDILASKGFRDITAYEIDSTLENKSGIRINYTDFLSTDPNDKFKVIIGNPPYVRWKNMLKEVRQNLRTHPYWRDKVNGLSDLLYSFIYLCAEKLENDGELIFITPMFWTETMHARTIRKYLSELGEIELIITFNEMRIFKEVSSTIVIFKFVKRKTRKPLKIIHVESKQPLTQAILDKASDLLKQLEKQEYIQESFYEAYIHSHFLNGNPWLMIPPHVKPILDRLEKTCLENAPVVTVTDTQTKQYHLSELLEEHDLEEHEISKKTCQIVRFTGKSYFVPKNRHTIIMDWANSPKLQTSKALRCPRLGDIAHIGNGLVSGLDKAFKVFDDRKLSSMERSKLIPVIKARNLRRYWVEGFTPYVFVNDVKTEDELKSEYPNIHSQLLKHKSELVKRYQYKRNIPWWHWVFLRNFDLIANNTEKIVVPCKERIDKKGFVRFSITLGKFYVTQDATAIVKKQEFREDTRYLLALLNSDVILTWLKYKGLRRGGVLEFSERPLASIPIRLINWENKEEVKTHNTIIELVNQSIQNKKLEPYRQKIELLVERLYGLRQDNVNQTELFRYPEPV